MVRSPCLTPTVVDNSLPTGTSKPGSPQVALPYLQEATDLFSHLLLRKTRLVNGGYKDKSQQATEQVNK